MILLNLLTNLNKVNISFPMALAAGGSVVDSPLPNFVCGVYIVFKLPVHPSVLSMRP